MDEVHTSLDARLKVVGREIPILKLLDVTNKEEVREGLKSGTTPDIDYPTFTGDAEALRAEVRDVQECIPDDDLGYFLAKKAARQLRTIDVIESRGDREAMIEAQIPIYGGVDASLYDAATKILTSSKPKATNKIVDPRTVRVALENRIRSHGLRSLVDSVDCVVSGLTSDEERVIRDYVSQPDNADLKEFEAAVKEMSNAAKEAVYGAWKVGISPGVSATKVNGSIGSVTVQGGDRLYTAAEHERLPNHEVDVHVLRAHNGRQQPLEGFATGMGEYMATEEGLASYVEKITETTDVNTMRKYAARVVAANALIEGQSFRQTYDTLREFDVDDETAFDVTLRVFRGGGYIKDKVYLQGFREVSDFVEQGGDITQLYVGKFALEDLDRVNAMVERGVLQAPQIIPSYLKAH